MKFSEMEYKRPDMTELKTDFKSLLNKFNKAEGCELQKDLVKEINDIRIDFESMKSLAFINYSVDTQNKSLLKINHIMKSKSFSMIVILIMQTL